MKSRNPRDRTAGSFRWRAWLILGLLLVAGLGLLGQAAHLQLYQHDFYATEGNERFSRITSVTAHRGMITDRNGEPLAISTPVDSVWVNPQQLSKVPEQIPHLAQSLKLDRQELVQRVTSNEDRQFLYVARHLPPADAQKVRDLGIPGVYLKREYRRYYPSGEVTGQMLGFTDVDDAGQEGVELSFDHWLAGTDGAKRVIQDGFQRVVQNVESIRDANPGHDLKLSIDLRIQYLAYRELKAAVRDQRAKAGNMVVLDVRTGEILAMVNQPGFNPNDREGADPAGLPQSGRDRHPRARLRHQTVFRRCRHRIRQVRRSQHHRYLAGIHQGRHGAALQRRTRQPRQDRHRDHPGEELERGHDPHRPVAAAAGDLDDAVAAGLRSGECQRLSGRVGGHLQ